jgi:hypothetical protein
MSVSILETVYTEQRGRPEVSYQELTSCSGGGSEGEDGERALEGKKEGRKGNAAG